jgi:hypothetical protein
MEDSYDIGVDVGEGKDRGVQCWIRIGDDGKYIPATVIDTTTTISFADSVQRSGCVGLSTKTSNYHNENGIVLIADDTMTAIYSLR